MHVLFSLGYLHLFVRQVRKLKAALSKRKKEAEAKEQQQRKEKETLSSDGHGHCGTIQNSRQNPPVPYYPIVVVLAITYMPCLAHDILEMDGR